MNPLTVERQYQQLLQTLPLLASRRGRLLQLAEFLELLCADEQRASLRAYAPELVPSLLRDILAVHFPGTPRSFVLRIHRLLDQLHTRLPAIAEQSEWSAAETVLVKEEARVAELVRQPEQDVPRVMPDRMAASTLAERRVIIPVVEREMLLRGHPPSFAALRTIHVELSFSSRAHGEDEILVDQVYDVDGVQHRQVRVALSTARRFLKLSAGIEDERLLILHCSFDEPNIIVGESLGAALTFAIFVELIRLYELRDAISLRPGVAITGALDAEGKVAAVDEHGLRLKVQACAASWMRFLIVPRGQEGIAREALEEFRVTEQLHPPLEIVGVVTLEEVLFDRRLTTVQRTALPRYLAGRIWRHRRSMVIVGSILVTAVIIRLWYGPFDKNPALIEFRQESLVVQNSDGQVLFQTVVGRELSVANNEVVLEGRNAQVAALADVDADGMNELIYIRKQRGDGEWTEVCLRSRERAEPIWTRRLVRSMTFGSAEEQTEYRFIPRGLVVDDADNDGSLEVYVYATLHNFYPSILLALNASDGREIGEYVHLGRLTDIAVLDIDNDAGKEVIACGINNAFRSAGLAVFSPTEIRGMSPGTEEFRPKEYEAGAERAYLLIPRSLTGSVFRAQTFGNMATRLGDTRTGSLEVGVKDFDEYVSELGERVQGLLTMTMRSDLTVKRVEVSEPYAITAEILLRKGRLDVLPDEEYFREYVRGIRYWDGKNWTAKPTLRKPSPPVAPR